MILTVDQVAERLQLPPAHVREMIRDGILPGFKRSKRLWGVSEEVQPMAAVMIAVVSFLNAATMEERG